MRVCFVDPQNLTVHQKPQTISFPHVSTERAELENFADAIRGRRPLAIAGGDEVHGVAVLEAVLESAAKNTMVKIK